ncbi:SMI1/KNR4 family protein [Verrucomicrobium sp. BvORR034]|uniref:SMI1/KNR4 family protein n=1 Tax=Verrucomicrobium sp. BvORR034 TaxID=1396418 RepID=UPI0009DF34C7|nr:SMI1/KNR4 family protein [Verrucomicrobium sp. BvORR034]
MNPNIPTFPELVFLDEGRPATSAELDEFERRVGLRLPQSLRAWLGVHNGSMLDRVNYFIPMQRKPYLPCSIGVEYLLSVNEISQALDQFGASFPPNLVPFGSDGDGNYLLMTQDGTICFWDWSGRIDRSSASAIDNYTIRIAESLPVFLSELGVGPLTENDGSPE